MRESLEYEYPWLTCFKPLQKLSNLILVAVHACMGTFAAAGIIPAYAT
jgi:hypothetical protein